MASATQTVGQNVRRFRHARGMSLVELARVAKLSKGTLTQLEAGRANPTVDTLHALSRALGATLGDLVADPPGDGGPTVVRQDEGALVAGWDMEARLVQRTHAGSAIIELYALRLEAGSEMHSPAHAAGVHEHLYVTEGAVLTGPDDEPVALGTGDFVRFAADRPHCYGAPDGDAAALLTMLFPAAPLRSLGHDEPPAPETASPD